jgi:hypothetical protein
MGCVRELHPGSELAGYRIEAVEREDGGAAVLLAHDTSEDREVALHVAGEGPGALSTMRFLERAHRLGSVEHPHLLDVYGARTLDDRVVAVAQAPPGRRLDQLVADRKLASATAIRIVRQVAGAVDALEEAGAEPPPLTAERIWVDRDNAFLDGLYASGGIAVPGRGASSSAALARLLEQLTANVSRALRPILTRATDGAYLSAGQLENELRKLERAGAQRRRLAAIAVMVIATLALAVIALAVVLNG